MPKSPTDQLRSADKSNGTSLIVNVLVVGTAPTVDAVIASQIGAVALVPVPVDDKNILVVVIFPARLVGTPIAFE